MKRIKVMLLAIVMMVVAPALITSCREDAPEINYTMNVAVYNDFSQVVDAINSGSLKSEQAIAKLTEAIDKMSADQQTKLQAITDILTSTNATLDTKLAAIEAAMKAQTLSLEGKLTLLETAIKSQTVKVEEMGKLIAEAIDNSREDLAEKLTAIEQIIKSTSATMAEKLAAIEGAMKAQTLALETKLALLETAVEDQTVKVGEMGTLIADAIDNSTETLSEKLTAIEQIIKSSSATLAEKLDAIEGAMKAQTLSLETKLDLLETAIKNLPDYSTQLEAIKAVIESLPDYGDKLDALADAIEALPDYGDKLTALENAIKALPDYSNKFDAVVTVLEDMKTELEALGTGQTEIAGKITEVTTAINALVAEVKAGNTAAAAALAQILQILEDFRAALGGGGTAVPVTGVTLDKTTLSLTVGNTATLVATVEPADATNKEVTWSSDDEAIATVDNTGKVTAVAAGTATITVTTVDGGKTATCAVTVTAAGTPAVAVSGVTLDKTTLILTVGRTETLVATVAPDDATDKSVTWASDDETIATVDNTGKVTALAAGTAIITVTTVDGGKTATCDVTVTAAGGEETPEDYVDLGLPSGLKWAKCNLGATKPSDYGDFYAWGETEPKDRYGWDNYKWGPRNAATKYNATDGKSVLEPEDDAATAKLGAPWRMPTKDEIIELLTKCNWIWTTQDSKNGYEVIGPNGNSFFLPAGGLQDNGGLYGNFQIGTAGYYWSSTLSPTLNDRSWQLEFESGAHNCYGDLRNIGMRIRPVRP